MSKRTFVPPNIAARMSQDDRRRYGITTPEEDRRSVDLTLERDIHNQFAGWLHRHGFEDHYHSDPVRRATIRKGLPDFGIYRDSKILFVEFKVKPNGLTSDQEEVFERMGRRGNVILICYSYDEARLAAAKFFNLPIS